MVASGKVPEFRYVPTLMNREPEKCRNKVTRSQTCDLKDKSHILCTVAKKLGQCLCVCIECKLRTMKEEEEEEEGARIALLGLVYFYTPLRNVRAHLNEAVFLRDVNKFVAEAT